MIVIDNKANKLRLHSCSDGKLLALSEILSGPQDVCLVNGIGTQVAVAQLDGCITILSVESAGQPAVVKIRQLRLLDVTSEFKHCYGLRALKSGEKLVVSGSKWNKDSCEDWICWGLVSLVDGHVSTVYKICRGAGYSYLNTSADDSMVYISCYAGYDSEDNGVYAFNVTDGKKKFFYFHRDMKRPEGITVDRMGFIYVCDWCCSCIYQLTPQGKLVTVHSQGMLPWPQAMYCGEQQEKLYVTTWWSNKIRIFLPVWRGKKDLVSPADLSKMDPRSLHMYSEALKNKREKVYNIRVMVVGHMGVGKTTLVKRLLGEEVDISERCSTEGIDVHTECCRVSLKTGEWTRQGKDSEQDYRLQRLARVINAKQSQFNITDEEQVVIPPPGEITHESNVKDHAAYSDGDALVSVSDFGGQFAFYSTHQMFLTRRAIYLLVLDVSQLISDLVDDEWFFDYEGKMKYKVRDLVEVWMNTIHSCAQLPEDGTPPVILVGTHVDYIPQHNHHEVCNRYFREIRSYLRGRPSSIHLVDEDFVIDNSVLDSKLEDLKRKIVEVASQQPYWGEEIPTYWLLLEQQLMKIRDAGVKVVPLSLVEEINNSGSVRIEDRHQLDLFLKFQHDMGTFLYFSVEVLRENVVLDPQWLIDALKSLITAEMFVLRSDPAVHRKWFEFKENGKLSRELIDAIWTRDRFPDFHDNKGYILLLLEHLNIIVTPRVYSEDGSEIREENYFLVPCMLKQSTPREIISPIPHPHMESSSVLCYVFLGKFLPTAIFHRLLAACVAHWPIARKKREEMLETLIFCACCVFQLDQLHKLTLHFSKHVICVRVTRIGITDKTPSSKLCIEAREFITTSLLKIIGYLSQSLKFEYFIQCPEYFGVSINSLIPVSLLKENAEVFCDCHDNIIESRKLLKFWFGDQEQSGDSDASSSIPMPPGGGDTDRFMRLTYLLVDVGSRILRQLLSHHTVTPNCTLDQYLAKNKGTINSLLKRNVLHQSQMDILFPPNAGNTNIEDYDVTLLSTLFNNIVPSLTQQEEDMIKSLREDRNKLLGHAKSCKMNAMEYQTCWNSISSTLITLSQQCGDPNFQNEISQEIQRIQVSPILTGSYLDILKTWFSTIDTVKGSLDTVKGSLDTVTGSLDTVKGSLETVKGSLETAEGAIRL